MVAAGPIDPRAREDDERAMSGRRILLGFRLHDRWAELRVVARNAPDRPARTAVAILLDDVPFEDDNWAAWSPLWTGALEPQAVPLSLLFAPILAGTTAIAPP